MDPREKRTNVLDDARTTKLEPTMGHLCGLWVHACFRRGRKVRHTTLLGPARKQAAHTWQILALFHWCIVSLDVWKRECVGAHM